MALIPYTQQQRAAIDAVYVLLATHAPDGGALRAWARNPTPTQLRLALNSPSPDLRATAEALQ